jgi:uncharacterized membrane protein YbhN (UPF0104 family)
VPSGRVARRVARPAFVLAVLAGLAVYLRAEGPAFADAVGRTSAWAVVASLLAVLVGLLCSALVWRSLLRDLGSDLPLGPALHVFFLGQLGKYVPGSVFAVAAQMELGREHGVSRSRVGTASLLFMGVLVATGLLVAAATLPLSSPGALDAYGWVLLALPLGLVCLAPLVLSRLVGVGLRVLRRAPLDRPLSARGLGAAVGWSLAMWAAYGVHAWLLLRAQPVPDDPALPLLAVGAYALAWTVGFLVVVAPAGGGAREAALVVALAPVLAEPDALAVAVLSRVVMTAGDLLWGGAGAVLGRRAVPAVDVKPTRRAADA